MKMLAWVTSIGETTTDLCVWSLERQGFRVQLLKDPDTTLAEKLKFIYDNTEEDFLRVDADTIATAALQGFAKATGRNNLNELWIQPMTFNWHAQKNMFGGAQFLRKEILPLLRANIGKHLNAERPETEMWRLRPLVYPHRRCASWAVCVGINGYKQKDLARVKATKKRRDQLDEFDFELAERMEQL